MPYALTLLAHRSDLFISLHHSNDFLDNKCDIDSAEEVAADIVTVIGQIVDNSPNEDIKILYFGYSVPSDDVCGNGQTAQLFEEQGAIIFNAIKSSNYTEYVTTFDISEMFVKWGSGGLSDPSYYYDEIHLNMMGYMHLFSSYKVQHFFGCGVAQTIEMKGISALAEGKDDPAHLAGTVAAALVGLIVGIVALVLAVKFVKRKMAMRGSSANVELLDEKKPASRISKTSKFAKRLFKPRRKDNAGQSVIV